MACVQWSHNKTSKGIRHIQIRKNAVRESVQNGSILVLHVAGKNNLSDIFTKEDKDNLHYISIRDALLSSPPTLSTPSPTSILKTSSPTPTSRVKIICINFTPYIFYTITPFHFEKIITHSYTLCRIICINSIINTSQSKGGVVHRTTYIRL